MSVTNIKGISALALNGTSVVPEILTTGKIFYVDSVSGSNGNSGLDPNHQLATIDYAIGLCTANKGDTILVAAGHTETIAVAGGITCDIAGVNIIGLGSKTGRPTVTWSTTASTWLVTAANVVISNIRCLVSVDSVVIGIDISAAGCVLDRVDFIETSAKQMLIFINTNASAKDLTIQNCQHRQAAAGSAKWIDLVGADRVTIRNNFFHVNATTHIVGGTTTESLEVLIVNNNFINPANAAGVVLLANTTGFVGGNFGGGAKASQVAFFALASAYGGLNYATNVVNTNGTIDPAADT